MNNSTEGESNSSSMSPDALPPSAIAIPILALLACLVCVPPLVAHLRARNLAATILVVGVVIINLQNFINALIWPRQPLRDKWDGKGLCDVEVKLYIGIGVSIVGATASIFRQLATILDTDRATLIASTSQRRRNLAFELMFCIGLPVYLMAVHYIVQPQRYWLLPISGCTPSFHSSWPSYVLVLVWPVVVSTVGATYCGIAVFRLIRYRCRVSSILSSSSSITKARYVRLFALALALLLAYLPLSIYTFVTNLRYTQYPFSWSVVHPPDWSHSILRLPLLDSDYTGFDRWVQIGTGFALFLFFGLGHEAVVMYKSWLTKIGFAKLLPGLDQSRTALSARQRSLSSRSPLVPNHQQRNLSASQAEEDAGTMKIGSISDTELGLLPAN